MTTKNFIHLLTLILILTLAEVNIFGQNFNKRNTVYGELLGTSGSILSIHYDRIFYESNKLYFDLTAGFGYFPSINNSDSILGIPVSLNLITGKNNHHFELGVGLTYNSGLFKEEIKIGNEIISSNSLIAIYNTYRIGYKYQKPDGGLFIRANVTPFIRIKTIKEIPSMTVSKFFPNIGLGIGYSL